MDIPGFTTECLELVNELLFAEGQENKLLGQCGQKKLREQARQPRTPAQEQADQARAQAMRGRTQQSSATRSEAATKAAETRKRCKGGNSTTGPTVV
jgi:hypothetical protein